MTKVANKTKAAVPAAPATTTAAVVLYGIGKLPRNGLHNATKHGDGGTAGTWAAVLKALQANPNGLSLAAIKEITTANKDPGFAGYAVRRFWLLPVQPTK